MVKLFSKLFKTDLGIDLGTSTTKVYQKSRGIVYDQPTVIAIQKITEDKQKVIALGDEAKLLLGKTPESVQALCPIQESVIHDYQPTELMLKEIFAKLLGSSFSFKPVVLITVPIGITEVEKRAVRDSVLSAGARAVHLVSEPLASAIGSNLAVSESSGTLLLDIGGGTTEVALLSMKGFVFTKSLRVGGAKMDDAIVNYVRKKYSLLIGETTAEQAKLALSDCILAEETTPNFVEIKGRDLVRGTPRTAEISNFDIREAIDDSLRLILSTVRLALENIPPELASDIVENGLTLTGGVASMKNLDHLFSRALNLPVYVPEMSRLCAVEGLGKMLSMEDSFLEFAIE
ncbi:MAG: rod shape-determining protein [Deltaproteobacteria bacterium]|nr:rod shape-determining protein [Deltaproteobacteria bacterium]